MLSEFYQMGNNEAVAALSIAVAHMVTTEIDIKIDDIVLEPAA